MVVGVRHSPSCLSPSFISRGRSREERQAAALPGKGIGQARQAGSSMVAAYTKCRTSQHFHYLFGEGRYFSSLLSFTTHIISYFPLPNASNIIIRKLIGRREYHHCPSTLLLEIRINQ